MLKKTVSAIFVGMLIAASSASAAINVTFQGLGGFLRSDDSTGLLAPSGSGNTALVQLIFTPNNSYGAAFVSGGVDAGESVLTSLLLVEGGNTTEFGEVPATSYGTAFSPGYLYVRVFDQGTGLGGSGVGVGTWYYNSPIYATIDNITPETPDLIQVNANTSSGGLGDPLNLQVIPEPATFALLGLGGLVLVVRRRFSV